MGRRPHGRTTVPSRSLLLHLLLPALLVLLTPPLFPAARPRAAHAVRVQALSVDSIDKLRRVLRSGEPWLIGCHGAGKDVDATVTQTLDQTANTLGQKKYRKAPDAVQVGYVDCKAKLKSGKSLKSKFKLKFTKGIPTFFFVGNGREPRQLKVEEFTTKDKKDKTKLLLAPSVMARHVARSAVPKVRLIDSDTKLRNLCLKQKGGAMLLLLGRNGGPKKAKLSKSQERIVTTLMRENRALRVCAVNLGKNAIQLPKKHTQRLLPRAVGEGGEEDDVDARFGSVEVKPPRVLFVTYGPDNAITTTTTTTDEDSGDDDDINGDDSDNGTPRVYGSFRHLNARSKQWDAKTNSSPVSMSLCRHLIHDQMDRSEARRVFEENKVELSALSGSKRPESIFSKADALYRINGRYYTWETAAPFLAAMALFDGSLSTDALTRLDTRVMHKETKAAVKLANVSAKAEARRRKESSVHKIGLAPLDNGKFTLPALRKAVKRFVSGELENPDKSTGKGKGRRATAAADDDTDGTAAVTVLLPLKKGLRPKLTKYVSAAERERELMRKVARSAKRKEAEQKKKRKAARKKKQEAVEKKQKAEETTKARVRREQKKRRQMDKMAAKHFVQSSDEAEAEEDKQVNEDDDAGVEYGDNDGDDGDDDDDDDDDSFEDEELEAYEDEEVIDLDDDDEDGEVVDLDDLEEEEEDDNEDVVDLDEL